MAGIAQVLSDCRSDTEDVLALRLTDAMLMCNPNATSALLRKYTSNPPPLSLWVDFDSLLVALPDDLKLRQQPHHASEYRYDSGQQICHSDPAICP